MSMVYTHKEVYYGLKTSIHFCEFLGVDFETDGKVCRLCDKRLK